MARFIAPYKDYAGNKILEGDWIIHPTGETGIIIYNPFKNNDEHDNWFVDYKDDSPQSRLSLQVGDKGQAVVI